MARDPVSENALLRKSMRYFEAVRLCNDAKAAYDAAVVTADGAFAEWQRACYDAEGSRADVDYPGGDPTVPYDADPALAIGRPGIGGPQL